MKVYAVIMTDAQMPLTENFLNKWLFIQEAHFWNLSRGPTAVMSIPLYSISLHASFRCLPVSRFQILFLLVHSLLLIVYLHLIMNIVMKSLSHSTLRTAKCKYSRCQNNKTILWNVFLVKLDSSYIPTAINLVNIILIFIKTLHFFGHRVWNNTNIHTHTQAWMQLYAAKL
jgi:hypothetical protein